MRWIFQYLDSKHTYVFSLFPQKCIDNDSSIVPNFSSFCHFLGTLSYDANFACHVDIANFCIICLKFRACLHKTTGTF